jgi:hydroxymethylpyrimidine pyrophosphatase-like HAD family hydrolase
MRPTYEDELDALETTYRDVLGADLRELEGFVGKIGSGPASFIGSGGMLAVATLAAGLHESGCLQPGAAKTPLAAIHQPALASCGAMLFSSSGKHPDAREVMRRLGRTGMRPAAVLTHREAREPRLGVDVAMVTLPPLPIREGFLAVNSVMSMCVALVRAYAGEVLPARLPRTELTESLPVCERLVVLYPPPLAAVAVDLETRLAEIGLAAVQLADYRNFAHGRHTGLQRNMGGTAVLALSEESSEDLAEATLAALPPEVERALWHTGAPWPQAALELLVSSMRACGELGKVAGVEVSRPKVPRFGRTLYRLAVRRRLPESLLGPVERKLGGFATAPSAEPIRRSYEEALESWTKELGGRRFGAVALDYDGTVCATGARFEPPVAAMAEALNASLARGLRLGFASGRGPSLHRDLRAVLDPEHWDKVELGLYNGGVLVRLDEELGDLSQPSPLIESASDRLEELAIAEVLEFAPRCAQLTIEVRDAAWMRQGLLAEVIADALRRPPEIAVKVLASGHSVDVVPAASTKVAVVERIRHRLGPVEVLCVGDQGQIGGNDFDLLAEQRWSLSVDRCSADPTRCWYLGDGSRTGPELALRYLKALRRRKGGVAIEVGELL